MATEMLGYAWLDPPIFPSAVAALIQDEAQRNPSKASRAAPPIARHSASLVRATRWQRSGAVYVLVGSTLYLGTILITIAFNLPRSEALAVVEPARADGASRWGRYVTRWTAWNHLRTVASLATVALVMLALR